MIDRGDTTDLLAAYGHGDARAADRLMPLVYDELRRIAQRLLSQEGAGHTLQATSLVNEAYLKLVDQTRAGWRDELHFLAVAAQAIRRILIDHARTRGRLKRGGDLHRLTLSTNISDGAEALFDLVELDDLLRALAEEDERAARIVELRYFGGLTIEQTAAFLDVSHATVERDWRFARAWLHRAMSDAGEEGPHLHE